jgi:3',5'-cyclic AMP phosphodiesterase CpdA
VRSVQGLFRLSFPFRRNRIALLVSLVISATTSCALCQDADTLNILHTSDLHLLFNPDECHPLLLDRHSVVRGSLDSLERFFKWIPRTTKADALIVTGDVLDMFEGETRTHKLLADQVEQLRAVYDKCPVPLLLTLGNHDITTYVVHDMDSTVVESQTSAERARASWSRNIPCFHDGTYYSRVFRAGRTNYHFLFLDNGYSLHDGGRVIDKVQLDWLNEQVSSAGREPVILFFHIYFSVGDINGDGIYFKENGPLNWPTEKQCSEGLLKLVNENRNIKAMVVGHGHSNVFEGIQFPNGHKVYQIETGSVSEGASNWRLFQFTNNRILVSKPGSKKEEFVIDLNEKGE